MKVNLFFRITKARFEILANEICSIFIHEHPSIYFTPSIRQGKQILQASGKLWNHYNYIKCVLREAKLLSANETGTPANALNADEVDRE